VEAHHPAARKTSAATTAALSIIVFVTSQVKPEKLWRAMRPSRISLLTLPAFAAFAPALALADTPNCSLNTRCGLDRVLHLLYGAATVLTLVLAVVLVLAIYFYRRNKRSEPRR
jgi:hypothetical protein